MKNVTGKLESTVDIIGYLVFIIVATMGAPVVMMYGVFCVDVGIGIAYVVGSSIIMAVFAWVGVEEMYSRCKEAEWYHTQSQQDDKMFKKAEARLRLYLISKGLRPSYTAVHFAVLHGESNAEVERNLRRIYTH